MSGVEKAEDSKPEMGLDGPDEQLVSRANVGWLKLTGKCGVLQQLIKRLMESALDGEITLAMTSTTRPAAGPATRVTAPARRSY